MPPRMRVVVVTYNNETDILECIESLKMVQSVGTEIVVVDNGSSDRTVEVITSRFPDVRVIGNKSNLGYAGGNNSALFEPLPEYVVFLNPDTWTEQEWFSSLLEDLDRCPSAGMAQPRIMLYNSRQYLNSRGNEANFLLFGWPEGYGQPDLPADRCRRISFPSGCAFAVRRDTLRAIGGFDSEYFMYGEDLDIGLRGFLRGWDVIYSPTAVVYHKYQYRVSPEKYFLLERNRSMTLLKVYRVRTLTLLAPILLATEASIILRSISEGWFVEKVRSYFSVVENARHIFRERRKIQSSRCRSDKDLLELLQGGIHFTPIGGSKLVRVGNTLLDRYQSFLLGLRIIGR